MLLLLLVINVYVIDILLIDILFAGFDAIIAYDLDVVREFNLATKNARMIIATVPFINILLR